MARGPVVARKRRANVDAGGGPCVLSAVMDADQPQSLDGPEPHPAPAPPPEPGEFTPPPARGGRRGRATRRLHPDTPCLNCGDPTPGEYCRTCGQRKVDVQVSLRAMLADALEDELSVDRRLPATLSALLLRPGQLTVDYVNGRIVRYIRPLRLYLVSSIIFFLLLSFTSLRFIREQVPEGTVPAAVPDTVTLAGLDSARAALTDQIENPALPDLARIGLLQARAQIDRQRALVQTRDAAADGDAAAGGAAPDLALDVTSPADATGADDGMAFLEGARVSTGIAVVDSALSAKLRELSRMRPRQAAERLVGDFIGFIPTLMFLLLPLFAGVLKLLYVRRRRYYAEHFIFLLHVHSVFYLLFTLLLLLMVTGWLPGWVVSGLLAWMAVYVLLAMRRVYGQSWPKTLLKWWSLGWLYFWILVLALPVAVVATLLL
jgi:hypothetical protein